jgi:hypothetical protein
VGKLWFGRMFYVFDLFSGASLSMHDSWFRIWCNGISSKYIKGSIFFFFLNVFLGIMNEGTITAVVNTVMLKGKMNFFCNEKKIPHTITNIPHDGVYLGVCCYIPVYVFIFSFVVINVPLSLKLSQFENSLSHQHIWALIL